MKYKIIGIIIAQMLVQMGLYANLQAENIKDNFLSNTSFETEDKINYILPIKLTGSHKEPYISGHYKGISIFEEGFLTIREARNCPRFTLVITPQVKCKKSDGLITGFKRLKNQKCRVFYITKAVERSGESSGDCMNNWHIQEESVDQIASILPKDAFIIFLHPDLVQEVSYDKNFENQDQETIWLPKITINSASDKQFEHTCIYALLTLPDLMAVSSSLEHVIKSQGSTISSLKIPRKY